jgi:hypothetical protein
VYQSLINLLLTLDLIGNFLVGIGFISISWAITGVIWGAWRFYENREDIKSKLLFISGILCFIIFVSCISFGSSHYMDSEWQIARAVATEVDKYNENNPESVFNPTVMLNQVDSAALSIFTAIRGTPELIRKLTNGTSMVEIKAERELDEFRAWKALQEKAE